MYNMNLAELCTPAQIYFVISIITLILAVIKQFKFSTIMMKLVTIAVWTWFLNFLCSKGYKSVSWFLVLLPFIVMALGFIMIMDTAAARAPQQRHPQQQQYRQ
jgi:F0F1-type ATP synthase assembly protein I